MSGSKWIVLIIAVLAIAAGAYFGKYHLARSPRVLNASEVYSDFLKTQEQYFGKTFPGQSGMGYIAGRMIYATSGFMPTDFEVYAKNLGTGEIYSGKVFTEEGAGRMLASDVSKEDMAYKLEVPAGYYCVYAVTQEQEEKNYRAYYSEFVKCGFGMNCPDHTPIIIKVEAGKTVTGVIPSDWHVQKESTYHKIYRP
ncbi:hypothetical protein ACFL6Y_02945 [Elusimicrobiota bacterium]